MAEKKTCSKCGSLDHVVQGGIANLCLAALRTRLKAVEEELEQVKEQKMHNNIDLAQKIEDAEAALEKEKKRADELDTVLGAWHSIFKTSQLSHASVYIDGYKRWRPRAEAAESSLAEAKAEIAALKDKLQGAEADRVKAVKEAVALSAVVEDLRVTGQDAIDDYKKLCQKVMGSGFSNAIMTEEFSKSSKQGGSRFTAALSRAKDPSKALGERDELKDNALRGAREWVKSSPHDDSCSWESNRSQPCDCGKVVVIERIAAALRRSSDGKGMGGLDAER